MTNEQSPPTTKLKAIVTAWWNQNGWKTIAMVSTAFVIVLGSLVVALCIESNRRDPTDGPNWADTMTAVSTALLAAFTALLALGAFFALLAVNEARRARHDARRAHNAVQMNELSKGWGETANLEARRLVYDYAKHGVEDFTHREDPGPLRLKESIAKLLEDNHPDYRKLFADPNFLEGIAILVKHGGLDVEIVKTYLGYLVPYRWTLWQSYVGADRQANSTEIYVAFEWLAKEIARDDPQHWQFDDADEIQWRGFKE